MTHASRDTTTGALFEERVTMQSIGKDISKNKLYSFLSFKGIDWKEYISRKLLPDEAYIDEGGRRIIIYEKKFQQTEGSANEKPQTCAFKIWEYRKLFSSLNIEDISYIYLLSDWFKKDKYKDMLDYIKSVDGCDYIIVEE